MSEANGTTPAQAPAAETEAPCDNCATSGEKILAVLAIAVAAIVVVMAFDLFTGGRVTGFVQSKTEAVSGQ